MNRILFVAASAMTWSAVAMSQQPVVSQPVSPATTQAAASATAPPTELQIKHMQSQLQDWPQLGRYREENASLQAPAAGEKRVVFLGDSITDGWGRHHGKFFPGKPYVNRGISGQTTPQMLVRFQQDVIALHPAVVVILAGTNDFAENTGPEPMSAIEDNVRSMVTLAKANHIRPVLSSTLPATRFGWHPGINPSQEIKEFNVWVKALCAAQGIVFLDYYSELVNGEGGMKPELTTDGVVHPNDAGYAIMEPMTEKAIAEALAKPAR